MPQAEDDPVYTTIWADAQHRGGTRRLPPLVVVLHHTGGVDSRGWLTTDPRSAVSAHLLISRTGVVYRLVEDAGIAYHAGESRWGKYGTPGHPSVNYVSLGIELENLGTGTQPYPSAQYRACARAIKRWRDQYGWIAITTHAAIAPGRKNDPLGFPWAEFNAYLNSLG